MIDEGIFLCMFIENS